MTKNDFLASILGLTITQKGNGTTIVLFCVKYIIKEHEMLVYHEKTSQDDASNSHLRELIHHIRQVER